MEETTFPHKLKGFDYTSIMALLAISQLRQLVLFNMKCSPIHTLAGILKKTTSAKNADLFSHCQSQLLKCKVTLYLLLA
jgi:hypothetical protein